jgi:mediator of RNA polymerase II transcription subunit 18
MLTLDGRLKSELIQETFTFVRDNVEFALSRWYHLPQSPPASAPGAALPAWSELKPMDPARKWMFTVALNVMEDNQPEKMKKANDELLHIRTELEQMFEFKSIDRRVFDTRIAKPVVVPK